MYQQLNSGICFVALVFFICRVQCMIDDSSEDGDQNAFENHTMRSFIQVQKCCPEDQMMVELAHWAPDYLGNDERIRPFEELHNLTATEENDQTSVLCAADNGPCISVLVGKPQCGPVRVWPIFTYPGFQEELQIRPYGVLRHVVDKDGLVPRHYEYPLEQYCVDAVRLLDNSHLGHAFHGDQSNPPPTLPGPTFYALICEPGPWDEADYFDYLIRVVYPVGLAIGLIALIFMVTVHLVLKELRDLSGCMLVSLMLSLIVSMTGNLILAATDSRPSPYINLIALESIVHSSDVAVHFWLNAIGHRAWTAVRYPRKEAMRPEGRRYMLYSLYAWGLSACVMLLALTVHFLIDRTQSVASPHSFFTWYKIGWLALALFCSTCVFLLLVNIYFFTATRIKISQQTHYGRTFHRHKGFYQAFTRLAIIIDSVWVIQTLSWLQFSALVGLRIIADIALPFLILWAALKGRRVMHLLKIRFQMSQCWFCRKWFAPNINNSRPPVVRRRPATAYPAYPMTPIDQVGMLSSPDSSTHWPIHSTSC